MIFYHVIWFLTIVISLTVAEISSRKLLVSCNRYHLTDGKNLLINNSLEYVQFLACFFALQYLANILFEVSYSQGDIITAICLALVLQGSSFRISRRKAED